jgi:hypothetical protein
MYIGFSRNTSTITARLSKGTRTLTHLELNRNVRCGDIAERYTDVKEATERRIRYSEAL